MKLPITLSALAVASAALFSASAMAASTATISFAAGAGYVDISLTNTTIDSLSSAQAGQLLTGVSFTVASGPADLTGSTVTVLSGDVISWEGGTKTDLNDNTGAAWAWGPAVLGYPNYLNALNGSVGGSGPDFGIVNSAVTGVGASLKNDPHNPMYQGTVVFRVANANLTVNTTFGNAQALFNTAPPSPVPEPESYALAFAGLGVVTLMMRRRRKA